jgi:hypothetical protein
MLLKVASRRALGSVIQGYLITLSARASTLGGIALRF